METEFIRWLREHLPQSSRQTVGLGDDGAILSFGRDANVVVTTDLLTEGVDYFVGKDDPRRIGRKALAANLSDLAAMAARPLAAFISIAFPRQPTAARTPLDLAIALYEGMLPLAAEYDVAIAGGDTNSYDGPLVISATLLGEVTERGPLTRSGGCPGDWLLVTGKLGGTILGHSFDFTPRVREALLLHEQHELHAGMDISDGLALDASRLAAESGCGALFFTDRIPIADAAHRLAASEARELDKEAAALRHALGDGEDFELLLAAPPEVAATMLREQRVACGLTHVGELVVEQGLWQQSTNGERTPLHPIGWLH
jgi:thiamine-monophosphate kinase